MSRVRSSRDEVTPEDQQRYAQARRAGTDSLGSATNVVAAWFNTRRYAVELEFRTGARLSVPHHFVPGLAGAALSDLVSVTVSPAGDALAWRALDVDVTVLGIIERSMVLQSSVSTTLDVKAERPTDQGPTADARTLKEADAARYIGMSAAWLKKTRTRQFRRRLDGPPFVRVGHKRIVYRLQDLDEWLARNLQRTSDPR